MDHPLTRPPAGPPAGPFAVLGVPAYRRLLLALLLSEIGLFAFETALFWAVLDQTGAASDVGILFAALTVPMLVLTVPVGILVDRIGPRGIMLVAAAAGTLVVGIGAVLAVWPGLSFELAFALAVGEGAFFACWAVPATVLAGRVVRAASMPSAIALTALPAGLGSIAGGSAGGIMVELGGAAAAFAFATACLAVAALVIVGLPRAPGLERAASVVGGGQLVEGVRWIAGSPVAVAIVVLGAVAGLLVMSRFAIQPSLVRDVFGAGPAGLGFLVTAAGVGYLVGTLATEPLGRTFGRGRALLGSLAIAGATMALLGVVPALAVALVLAAVISVCVVVYQMTSVVLLQILVPARMRGRVLALFDVVRLGLIPPGSLAAGAAADALGVPLVLAAFGLLAVGAVVVTVVLAPPLVSVDATSPPLDEEAGALLEAVLESAERPPPD